MSTSSESPSSDQPSKTPNRLPISHVARQSEIPCPVSTTPPPANTSRTASGRTLLCNGRQDIQTMPSQPRDQYPHLTSATPPPANTSRAASGRTLLPSSHDGRPDIQTTTSQPRDQYPHPA